MPYNNNNNNNTNNNNTNNTNHDAKRPPGLSAPAAMRSNSCFGNSYLNNMLHVHKHISWRVYNIIQQCVYICIYVYMYVCIYVYMYVCIYTWRHAYTYGRVAESIQYGDLAMISPTIISDKSLMLCLTCLARGMTCNVMFESHCLLLML